MEYLLGSVFSILLLLFLSNRSLRLNNHKKIVIKYSQSHKHELLKFSYLIDDQKQTNINRQSYKHYDSNATKVLIFDEKAYWIANSRLHSADVDNGKIVETSTKIVDTMALDDVELKKIIFVIDKLNEEV